MINEVLKLINKFIPNGEDKNNLILELSKLELEEFKAKKGIIRRFFHSVFPLGVFVLICMYIVEFYLRVRQYLTVGEWITISIVPNGLELMCLVFLSLLMPKKILEPIMTMVMEYFKNKIGYEKKWK